MTAVGERIFRSEQAERSRRALEYYDAIHIDADYITDWKRKEEAESIVVGLAKILGTAAFVFLMAAIAFYFSWRN